MNKMIAPVLITLLFTVSQAFAGSPSYEVTCSNKAGVKVQLSVEGCISEFKMEYSGKATSIASDCQSNPNDLVEVEQDPRSNFVLATSVDKVSGLGHTDKLILTSSSAKFRASAKKDYFDNYEFTARLTHFYRRNGVKNSKSFLVNCTASSFLDY